MSEIIFESQFYSLSGEDYRVRLYGKNYIGLDAAIIGGSANVFYVANDWTVYTRVNHQVLIDGVSGVVTSLVYNEAENRTEIAVPFLMYTGQTEIKNDIGVFGSFEPVFAPVITELKTEYENSNDYLLSPLITSRTDLIYANVKEDRTVDNDTAFFDRFIELYLQSDDDELRVTIERNVSGYELEWAGNLVMDLIEWNNESSPRLYTFRAICGIDRLKDVEYDGDITSLQNKKIKDIILDVLALNGLDEFWGASDVYIRESIEYQSVDVTSVNASDSPIDYSYLYENLLLQKSDDTKDNRVFLTGYDILYGLMELFSARLMHTNGHYYIQQIRNYDTTTIASRSYVKAGTYVQGNYTHSNDTLRVLAGGKFGYLYGIKQARIESENKDIINIGQLPPNQMHGVFYMSAVGQSLEIRPTISQNIGDIEGGLAANQYLNVQFDINTIRGLNFDADIVVRFSVYESSGNKFLKGSDTIAPFWNNAVLGSNKYYEKKVAIRGNGNLPIERVTFQTPVIPYEMESVVVSLELVMTNIRAAPSNNTAVFFLSDVIVAIPTNGDDNIEQIYVDNPNTKFTKDLQLNNLIINEGSGAVQANNLSVDANYNTGSVSYATGGLWDADFDANGSLSVTRVLEAVSLQYKPLQRYMGGFEGLYYPYQTIPYNNTVFATKKVEINYLMDEINGEWFEVLISRVGISGGTNGTGDTIDPKDVETIGRISRELDRGVGILDTSLDPNLAITSIDINSTGDIRQGDIIQVVGETGDVLLELEAAEDLNNAGAGETLTVESFDLDVSIPSGSRIIYGYKKMFFSEKIRFNKLEHTDGHTAPTAVSDMKEGEIIFVGRDIYVREGESVFRHRASPYLP